MCMVRRGVYITYGVSWGVMKPHSFLCGHGVPACMGCHGGVLWHVIGRAMGVACVHLWLVPTWSVKSDFFPGRIPVTGSVWNQAAERPCRLPEGPGTMPEAYDHRLD